MLTQQTITLSLREGLDTKTDPKQVIPGRLLVLENGILTKIGSIQKRNGFAALPSTISGGGGGALAASRLLTTFKGQLFLTDTAFGYSYAPSQSAWAQSGPCEACQISVTPVVRTVYQQTTQDSAIHLASGVQVVAWEDSSVGAAFYSVIDATTGLPLVPSTRLGSTALKPKCLVLGNYLIIVYFETSTNHLRYLPIPVLTPGSPLAATDIATDPSTNEIFDATVVNNRLFLAYANNLGGTTQLSLRFLSSTFVASNEFLVPGSTVLPTAVSIWGEPSGTIKFAWFVSPNVSASAIDFNLTSLLFSAVVVDSAATGLRNLAGLGGAGYTNNGLGGTTPILSEIGASPSYNNLIRLTWLTAFPNPVVLQTATASTTGGTLAAGTYYYVVTALGGGGGSGETLRSNELSVTTTGTTSSVTLSWGSVTGAAGYRIYRGTTAGGEGTYYSVFGVTTFTDTGAAGTAGTPPTTNTFVGVTLVGNYLRSVGLASKPWYTNSSFHFLAGYTSTLQPSYFVISHGNASGLPQVVGQIAPGNGGGVTAKTILPEVTQTSTSGNGIFSLPYLLRHEIGAQAGVVLAQTGVSIATLDYTAAQLGLELSDDLHVTGGLLYSFDGFKVAEHNFLLYPENIAATPSGTGGVMLAGQYQYAVVFEWWDAYGLHQSGVSVPVTVTTTGSTSSVALTIPTLRVTNRTTPISIAIYRTAANGTVFYRLNAPTSPLVNSTTADTVSYTDTVADSSIIGNAQLYTTGGEVENSAAPAPSVVCNYANRIMLVSAENPLTIWFSKQVVAGVPVEFSPTFQFTVDQRGGAITAMTQLDDKLIIFKRSQIFALVGDGPAPNGLPVPAYPPADRVTADSGCRNQKSLVLIPNGLMYQSDKGIYLLGRDLSTTYIGAAVEAYNSANVTSALQVPNTTQVRFTLDSGVCLVYDWLVDQWATFTNIAAADAAVYNDAFTYSQAGGAAFTETPGVFTDSGNPIKLRLQTSWLSFAGIQGLQRVWEMLVLGEYRSAHTLRVSVAFDFDPTPREVVAVNAATLIGQMAYGVATPYGSGTYGGNFPLYQFRVKMRQERCQAVQITLEDNQTAPYGEGLALSVISFVAGVVGTAKKVPASRTFGV